MKTRNVRHTLALICILLLSSCAPGLKFSEASNTEDGKVIAEAQTLINKSTEPFSSHTAEVDALKMHIDQVVAAEKKRAKNQQTVNMWTTVQTDRNGLYSYFDLWKSQGQMSQAMVTEMSKESQKQLALIQDWEQRKKGGPLNH
ncbi:hypothetical protein [Deminuibacter soli]|uniref:Uncharacterized protein n=1 Tax=Deminuibacter soli TaxID=2291815 RepID=A0A3E1NQM9_9BACT|nr:hypothetical protein [Deminuibacter soli]RFM30098.1 hypothetical protein DXN05_03750 [Deminuibacter soli]